MSETIHIHEDDWGMRNLYPVAALAAGSADVDAAAAAAAAERNRAPSGMGFTDIHVIAQPSLTYVDVGLTLAAAAAALAPIMQRVRNFNATASAGFDPNVRDEWGSYDTEAYCYALHRGCFVKLDAEGALVKYVWFEANTVDPAELATLRRAIEAINVLAPSGIVDYWQSAAGAVADRDFMDRYFRALAAT